MNQYALATHSTRLLLTMKRTFLLFRRGKSVGVEFQNLIKMREEIRRAVIAGVDVEFVVDPF